MQILQELFGLDTISGKVGRDDVHVISGTDSFFLFLDFAAVQIGDFSLHRLDGLDLIHRLDMQADNQVGFHIQKIGQHPVIQFRGENLHERNRPVLFTHAELLAGAELKGAGGDKVLGGQAAGGEPVPLKTERQLLIHVEDTMQLGKSCFAVQRFRRHTQPLEVVENVGLNALQTGLGRLDAVRVNAKGKILGFDEAVVALCQLVLQHGHVLDTDAVKIVPLERDVDGAGKGFLRCCKVQKRQLKLNRAVEVVEEIAPALEDRGFILVL